MCGCLKVGHSHTGILWVTTGSYLQSLGSKQPSRTHDFLSKYQQWISEQSRGGLSYPSEEMYLLVREFNTMYKQTATAHGSLLAPRTAFEVAVHDSPIMRRHWDNLVSTSNANEFYCLAALDYLIQLFCTIKGFAFWNPKLAVTVELGSQSPHQSKALPRLPNTCQYKVSLYLSLFGRTSNVNLWSPIRPPIWGARVDLVGLK